MLWNLHLFAIRVVVVVVVTTQSRSTCSGAGVANLDNDSFAQTLLWRVHIYIYMLHMCGLISTHALRDSFAKILLQYKNICSMCDCSKPACTQVWIENNTDSNSPTSVKSKKRCVVKSMLHSQPHAWPRVLKKSTHATHNAKNGREIWRERQQPLRMRSTDIRDQWPASGHTVNKPHAHMIYVVRPTKRGQRHHLSLPTQKLVSYACSLVPLQHATSSLENLQLENNVSRAAESKMQQRPRIMYGLREFTLASRTKPEPNPKNTHVNTSSNCGSPAVRRNASSSREITAFNE